MSIFSNWKKKKHYKQKVQGTLKKIWDIEFLREQYKLTREGFRTEYDRIQENLDALKTYSTLIKRYGLEKARDIMKDPVIAVQKANEVYENEAFDVHENIQLSKEEQEIVDNCEKEIKAKEDDLSKLKHQMSAIDVQIEGPAPVGGSTLNENIEGLRAVVGLLKDYIKKL